MHTKSFVTVLLCPPYGMGSANCSAGELLCCGPRPHTPLSGSTHFTARQRPMAQQLSLGRAGRSLARGGRTAIALLKGRVRQKIPQTKRDE